MNSDDTEGVGGTEAGGAVSDVMPVLQLFWVINRGQLLPVYLMPQVI